MPVSFKLLTSRYKRRLCVLACWEGIYYNVNVIKCDQSKGKCLVRFDDGADFWMDVKDLHAQIRCDLEEFQGDEDIFCCLCQEGESLKPNLIVICDVCQQGYHQMCHDPQIESSEIDNDDPEEEEWACTTCKKIIAAAAAPSVPSVQKLDLTETMTEVKGVTSTTSTPKVSLPKKKYTKYSPVVELNNGKTIEVMEPEVITAAISCIDTDKFSTLVCDSHSQEGIEATTEVEPIKSEIDKVESAEPKIAKQVTTKLAPVKKSRVAKKPSKNTPVPA